MLCLASRLVAFASHVTDQIVNSLSSSLFALRISQPSPCDREESKCAMSDMMATAPTVVEVQPSPVTEQKQVAATESVDAAAGSTSPALVPSKRIDTVCACAGRNAISKQNEEPPNQLPMVSLESSEVEKLTKGAVKRLSSPTRLHAPLHKRIRLAGSSDHQALSQEDAIAGTALSPLSIPPFASYELKKGPPSLSWENFKRPQLRRFPGPFTTYKLRYVGDGVDGIVFKTKTDSGEAVAMKIVRCEDTRL
jgi:hypothetical protein